MRPETDLRKSEYMCIFPAVPHGKKIWIGSLEPRNVNAAIYITEHMKIPDKPSINSPLINYN